MQAPRFLLHQTDRLFLTDGGLETTLVFHEGVELPSFAAFDLLKSKAGLGVLRARRGPHRAHPRVRRSRRGRTW